MATGADVVVSPLVQVLLHKLDSSVMSDFGKQWSTREELDDLSAILQLINRMVSSIEDMQIRDPCLPIFLGDLRQFVFKATVTVDNFIYEAHRQSVSGKIEIKEKIESKYLNLISSDKWCHDETERRLQTISSLDKRIKSSSIIDDSEIFGRREMANDVINLLLSDKYDMKKVPVFSIVGIGGIGKTTLAQLIYNDEKVVEHFEVRAWVCVSEESNIIKITRSILESMTKGKWDIENLQPLQCELQTSLSGKRFLLVLDDIWFEDRKTWDAVRVPLNVAAKKGSRIVVTTRTRKVSSIMNSIETIDLEGLPYEDGWQLFKFKAFIDDEIYDTHPNLKRIGENFVKKCKGVALAVKTLGGLLYNELDVNKWTSILESEMWELEGDDEILPALRLSYYHLPTHLKLCFAYCSLSPKDYIFDKKALVRLWMAEGFIACKQVEIMEDLSGKYFDELYYRSFFQKYSGYYGNTFVMHDLMHDLAESISKGLYLRVEEGKSERNGSIISEKAHYISMIDAQPESSMVKELYKYKDLSTLIFFSSSRCDWHIPSDLFEQYRCLLVLDLSGNDGLDSLPDSIGNLKHLCFLNLNYTGIEVLPDSLCSLYNLQTLMLEHCYKLDEIPENIGNLINLQYIEMNKDM
ncbi:PREDICTED: putative disease resistance protein RGA3 [Nelumbo nucifera]|uniref:Disease resistance protein RGA3 n=1 Tax=Nelumbo nucifera TaxID=4432 RepID=A0A1U8B5Y2_NELNU|nr:PREDICTED: putative disease resistance protein RGA3 [Nelumbo nucifera]